MVINADNVDKKEVIEGKNMSKFDLDSDKPVKINENFEVNSDKPVLIENQKTYPTWVADKYALTKEKEKEAEQNFEINSDKPKQKAVKFAANSSHYGSPTV
jgi:hypothetical protein